MDRLAAAGLTVDEIRRLVEAELLRLADKPRTSEMMTTQDVVIETRGLSKRYGDLERFASSTSGGRRIHQRQRRTKRRREDGHHQNAMGMIRPTAGEARVFGYHVDDPYESVAIRRRTAHVGEDRAAWPAITAEQVLSIS